MRYIRTSVVQLKKRGMIMIGIIVLLFFALSLALDNMQSMVIEDYEAIITLDDQGDMRIIERTTIDYRIDKRVRFRDIGYNKFPSDYPLSYSTNNTATFDTSSVGVRVWRDATEITSMVGIGFSWTNDRDELGELVRCEPNVARCESIFIDTLMTGRLSGLMTFEYDYTILGAVSKYTDISELNWVLFEYMEGKIKQGRIEIHLPANSFSTEELYIFGHGIQSGNLEIVSNELIVIDIKNVSTNEFLEFRVLAPNDLFPNIRANNIFIDDGINKDLIISYQENLAFETNLRILIAQVMTGLSIIIALGLAYLGNKQYKAHFKPHETQFEGDYYRDLPSDKTPAQMSYLYYFEKINNEDVTATLLDLVRRKYLLMEFEGEELTSKDASFLIRLNPANDWKSLLPHEVHLINWFIIQMGDGEKVRTKEIEDFGKKDVKKAEAFQRNGQQFIQAAKNASKSLVIRDNISVQKAKANRLIALPAALLGLSFLLGFVFNTQTLWANIIFIATIVLYTGFFQSIKRRTPEAEEAYQKWKAFRNFLVNFGNFEDYPMPGIIVWEHFLVYATSLKVADKVMEQLTVKLPMTEEMARQSTYMGLGYGRRGFVYGYGFRSFNQTVTRARTNAQTKINSQRSSGGGRGGGFSGGSSFGGGGGGGRSR